MTHVHLPKPLDSFVVENPTGSYKDFQLAEDDDYPLRGVEFFANYGYLPGFTGEDGHDLDLFVGDAENGECGFFIVWRNDAPKEHKFYVNMSEEQLNKTLNAYSKVLVSQESLPDVNTVIVSIDSFKSE